MKNLIRAAMCLAAVWGLVAFPAHASETIVTGHILQTQGHGSPSCRMVELQTTSGSVIWFRIMEVSNNDDGILAVTLTALSTGKLVDIDYDPSQTSGCGTEPRILWISIHNTN